MALRFAILSSSIHSQVRLATQTGIGEGRLSKIVNGWIEPTEPERELIAQALGRDADELFARQEVTA